MCLSLNSQRNYYAGRYKRYTKINFSIMAKSSKNGNGMPNAHLHELLVDELKDMYNAERQLLKGLKQLAEAAQHEEVKNAFVQHREETEDQIDKLKKVFELLDKPARGKKCKAMEGLLEEANEIASDFEGSDALDAALIAAAQKVEHYEIASYGTLCTFAEKMGHSEAVTLLEQILNNEKETDVALTEIAVNSVNEDASKE